MFAVYGLFDIYKIWWKIKRTLVFINLFVKKKTFVANMAIDITHHFALDEFCSKQFSWHYSDKACSKFLVKKEGMKNEFW